MNNKTIKGYATLVVIWILGMTCILVNGCEGGAVSTITPGVTTISATERVTALDPVTGQPVVHEREEKASSTGAGMRTSGDKLEQGFNASAAKLKLPSGGQAEGGGTQADASAQVSQVRGVIAAGVLCLLLAGAAVYFGLLGPAAVLAVIGAALLTVAIYPEVLVWAAIAGVVGLAVYLVWQAKQGKGFKEALRAVVSGVESASAEAAAAVKAEISKQADHADKAVIGEIKRQDGV